MSNMMEKRESVPQEIVTAGYNTNRGFELVQRIAGMFSQSTLVPEAYRGNKANCIIALEMAQRIGSNPLMTMQNMYIVHGRPAWSSQFLISCLNASKRFSPLRYRETGKKGTDSFGIIAWAKDLEDGEVLDGPEVTIAMAKAEGWYQKKGSKWQTMPALMCRYRAATFFARLYAPELTMGIRTTEEAADIAQEDIRVSPAPYTAAEAVIVEEPEIPEHAEDKEVDTASDTEQSAKYGLTPVADMDKASLKAELFVHAPNPYYEHIVKGYLPLDADVTEVTKLATSVLREVVTDLRDTAEAKA